MRAKAKDETAKAKGDVNLTPETEPDAKPHWEAHDSCWEDPATRGYHRTTHFEEFNDKWAEGSKVQTLGEIGKRVNVLICLMSAAVFINAAMLILVVSHMSATGH